jgi:hypothetical protein
VDAAEPDTPRFTAVVDNIEQEQTQRENGNPPGCSSVAQTATQTPGVVLEYPSIDDAAAPVVLRIVVVDTRSVVFSLVACSGFPAEFFTVVRYLPAHDAAVMLCAESWNPRLAYRRRPDFLNHALRDRPAENGLICDDGENS